MALCSTDDLRGLYLAFYVFTGILFSVGPPGGNRFVLRFYRHFRFGRPSGGRGLFVLRFYRRSLFSRPSGGRIFLSYVFTGIVFSVGPPGAPSFVARRKIGEKGVPKGSKAALWNLAFYTGVRRGDVRRPYEFARVQFTRFRPARRRAGGVRFTRLRRKARHHLFSAISLPKALLPPVSVVLHVTQWARNTH